MQSFKADAKQADSGQELPKLVSKGGCAGQARAAGVKFSGSLRLHTTHAYQIAGGLPTPMTSFPRTSMSVMGLLCSVTHPLPPLPPGYHMANWWALLYPDTHLFALFSSRVPRLLGYAHVKHSVRLVEGGRLEIQDRHAVCGKDDGMVVNIKPMPTSSDVWNVLGWKCNVW
eukprot:432320-Pelagomonas_calceolata.AAC.3